MQFYGILLAVHLLNAQVTPNENSQLNVDKDTSNSTVSSEDNGAPQEAIINGALARPGEFPFIVSIQHIREGDHFCGGSLIDWKHVITAAHCMAGESANNLVVGVGLRVNVNPPPDHMILVASFRQHEDYDPNIHTNDVAILTLAKPVPMYLRHSVNLVMMPTSSHDGIHPGMNLFTAGWGKTVGNNVDSLSTVLMKASMPVMISRYCQQIFGEILTSETQICLSNNKQSTCQGDSGGPLLKRLTMTGKFILVGLTSYGVQNCKAGTANVFTRVSQFLPWIRNAVRNNN